MSSFAPRRVASIALGCCLTASPSLAAADELVVPRGERAQPQAAAHDWRARSELALSIRHGIFIDGQGGGVSLGGELLHRRGLLIVGAVGEWGASVFNAYKYWGGGGALGVSAPSPSWLRLDLLGVAGAYSYDNVGALPFLSAGLAAAGGYITDQGSRAMLPFAGARLRSSLELGGANRFSLGLEAAAEADLTHATRTYESSNLGFGQRRDYVNQRTVGTERFAAGLTLGGSFDL